MNALTEAALLKAVDSGYLMIEPAPPTGKLVAVVGAGASGVACAHRLAMLGNDVQLFEARSRERMLQTPALLDAPEQDELERLLACGRIRCEYGRKLGDNLDLADLYLRHDAVYLGVGLAMARVLGLTGVDAIGLLEAGREVAAVYADADLPVLPVLQRVVVIGASHGALALALQLKKLGAHDVTLALRHTLMPDGAEMQAAREHFVRVRSWVAPLEVLRGEAGTVEAVRFEQTRMLDGCLVRTGGFTEIAANTVFKVVGNAEKFKLPPDPALRSLSSESERIHVNWRFRTTVPGLYAGGDCVAARLEETHARQHGVLAAESIHHDLQA